MSRSLPEWIGTTSDSSVPNRVRARVFELYHGTCQGCFRKLFPGDKWQCDHIVALCNGGENRELNLRPMCEWCHKKKTAEDVAEKSRAYRKRARHIGVKKPSRFACSRDSRWRKKINGRVEPR